MVLQAVPTMFPIRVGPDGTLFGYQPLQSVPSQQETLGKSTPICIVDGCPYNASHTPLPPDVILHFFPDDLGRIKQWLLQTCQYSHNLNVLAEDILRGKMEHFHICSCHFTPDSYTTVGAHRILGAYAIPTLFPRKRALLYPILPRSKMFSTGVSPKKGSSGKSCPASKHFPDANPATKPGTGKASRELSVQADLWKVRHDHSYIVQPPVVCKEEPDDNESVAKEEKTPPGDTEKDQEESDLPGGDSPGDDSSGLSDVALKNYAVVTALEKVLVSLMHHLSLIPLSTEEKSSPPSINTQTILKTEQILNQALDVIHLLTGVKWNITRMGVYRLPEKVPVQVGDFSVYFSNKEWEYIEEHKDLYKEMITEDPLSDSVLSFKEKWKTSITLVESNSHAQTRSDRDASPSYVHRVRLGSPPPEYGERDASPSPGNRKRSEDGEKVKPCSGRELHPDRSESPKKGKKHKLCRSLIPSDDDEYQSDTSGHSNFSDNLYTPSYLQKKKATCKDVTLPKRERRTRAAASKLQEELHWCDVCELCFPDKYQLVLHQTSHVGELSLQCTKCEKSFNQQSQLLHHHETVHNVARTYVCEQCGKSFPSEAQLTRHQDQLWKKHFRCIECGKYFNYKSQLVIHQRAHTGERPYECEDCGATFGHKSSLAAHKRTHTGKHPHTCQLCNKRFHKKSRLKMHLAMHKLPPPPPPRTRETKERTTLSCPDCGRPFVYKSSLLKHMKKHKNPSKRSANTLTQDTASS
uniref:Uncharacterized protein n=1 Tax=Leptobrachium leishanense TaxID=445787 RepID=A0A8C5QJL1_9ANUR